MTPTAGDIFEIRRLINSSCIVIRIDVIQLIGHNLPVLYNISGVSGIRTRRYSGDDESRQLHDLVLAVFRDGW
jgi:hypothetical protein